VVDACAFSLKLILAILDAAAEFQICFFKKHETAGQSSSSSRGTA
jgi:hypothetical protein